MQEIPKDNKNQRLAKKGKHFGGSIQISKSILDGPELDKKGMAVSDYR